MKMSAILGAILDYEHQMLLKSVCVHSLTNLTY